MHVCTYVHTHTHTHTHQLLFGRVHIALASDNQLRTLTSAYVSIRQHTSAYVSIRQLCTLTDAYLCTCQYLYFCASTASKFLY